MESDAGRFEGNDSEDGEKRLERPARFAERDDESDARSLREGMVGRLVASGWLLTENHFRKISGDRDLWASATILRRKAEAEIAQEKVA